jgi:hypothetical protein
MLKVCFVIWRLTLTSAPGGRAAKGVNSGQFADAHQKMAHVMQRGTQNETPALTGLAEHFRVSALHGAPVPGTNLFYGTRRFGRCGPYNPECYRIRGSELAK